MDNFYINVYSKNEPSKVAYRLSVGVFPLSFFQKIRNLLELDEDAERTRFIIRDYDTVLKIHSLIKDELRTTEFFETYLNLLHRVEWVLFFLEKKISFSQMMEQLLHKQVDNLIEFDIIHNPQNYTTDTGFKICYEAITFNLEEEE